MMRGLICTLAVVFACEPSTRTTSPLDEDVDLSEAEDDGALLAHHFEDGGIQVAFDIDGMPKLVRSASAMWRVDAGEIVQVAQGDWLAKRVLLGHHGDGFVIATYNETCATLDPMDCYCWAIANTIEGDTLPFYVFDDVTIYDHNGDIMAELGPWDDLRALGPNGVLVADRHCLFDPDSPHQLRFSGLDGVVTHRVDADWLRFFASEGSYLARQGSSTVASSSDHREQWRFAGPCGADGSTRMFAVNDSGIASSACVERRPALQLRSFDQGTLLATTEVERPIWGVRLSPDGALLVSWTQGFDESHTRVLSQITLFDATELLQLWDGDLSPDWIGDVSVCDQYVAVGLGINPAAGHTLDQGWRVVLLDTGGEVVWSEEMSYIEEASGTSYPVVRLSDDCSRLSVHTTERLWVFATPM